MKKTINHLLLFVLMIASVTSFADKILLTGRPVVLMPDADYYVFPDNYVPPHNFHFVNVSGDNRVCFLNEQLELKPLDLIRIHIALNNKKYLFYCYRYDSRYFTVDF